MNHDDPYARFRAWVAGEPPKATLNGATPRTATVTITAGGTSYALAALGGEVERLVAAPVGTRNNALNLAAVKMGHHVAAGGISAQAVHDALADAVATYGDWDPTSRSFEATFRSGLEAGMRDARHAPERLLAVSRFNPLTGEVVTGAAAAAPDVQLVVSSWAPVDLGPVLSGEHVEIEPEIGRRSDGRALFYAGKVHSVAGESESLKSWLCQVVVAQQLMEDDGSQVLYLDFEDDAAAVVGRLRALGCEPEAIKARLAYVRPADLLSAADRDALLALGARFAVIDGVTEAMGLHSLSPDSNPDAARFFGMLARPLADTGTSVVMIDHVTKSRENRGRWAIGAQHKMAAINGAAYTVELGSPFGRGRHGIARVKVAKDRPGQVRAFAEGGTRVVDLHMTSQPDGGIVARLQVPASTDGGGWRPSGYMERVSRTIERSPGLSKDEIEKTTYGKANVIREALERLIAENYVTVTRHGNAHRHRSLRPFREGDEDEYGDTDD